MTGPPFTVDRVASLKPPRAILFDWDNTLVDSWGTIHDALNFLNAFSKSLLDEAAGSRAGDVEEAVRRGRETLHLLSAQAAQLSANAAKQPGANAFYMAALANSYAAEVATVGAQVFKPFDGDTKSYYLAQNGGLESGATGWSLSGGASVVNGNQTLLPSGTHSLALPSGSSALSPQICLGPKDVAVRLFANDAGGSE